MVFSNQDCGTCSGVGICCNDGGLPTSYTTAHSKIASLDDQATNVNLVVSASLGFGSRRYTNGAVV